jgi:hypothetical protein
MDSHFESAPFEVDLADDEERLPLDHQWDSYGHFQLIGGANMATRRRRLTAATLDWQRRIRVAAQAADLVAALVGGEDKLTTLEWSGAARFLEDRLGPDGVRRMHAFRNRIARSLGEEPFPDTDSDEPLDGEQDVDFTDNAATSTIQESPPTRAVLRALVKEGEEIRTPTAARRDDTDAGEDTEDGDEETVTATKKPGKGTPPKEGGTQDPPRKSKEPGKGTTKSKPGKGNPAKGSAHAAVDESTDVEADESTDVEAGFDEGMEPVAGLDEQMVDMADPDELEDGVTPSVDEYHPDEDEDLYAEGGDPTDDFGEDEDEDEDGFDEDGDGLDEDDLDDDEDFDDEGDLDDEDDLDEDDEDAVSDLDDLQEAGLNGVITPPKRGRKKSSRSSPAREFRPPQVRYASRQADPWDGFLSEKISDVPDGFFE